MLQFTKGMHFSGNDFPADDEICKYKTWSAAEVAIAKDGVAFAVPQNVLHYIDDKEALQWKEGWKPPQALVDLVMSEGTIQLTIPEIKMPWDISKFATSVGYLTKDSKGNIVDTHGGDANMESATPAEFGSVPPEFIERMKLIVAASEKNEPSITFGPAKNHALANDDTPSTEPANPSGEPLEVKKILKS